MKITRNTRLSKFTALLISLCLMIGLLPMTAFAVDPPTQRNTYNVYAKNVINGGSDSQVYANTITVKRGGYDGDEFLVLHYVYSPNAIHSNELMEKSGRGWRSPTNPWFRNLKVKAATRSASSASARIRKNTRAWIWIGQMWHT